MLEKIQLYLIQFLNFLIVNILRIKNKVNPITKILNDNNFDISLNLYPKKIIEELTNKNKIMGDILFPQNLLLIK